MKLPGMGALLLTCAGLLASCSSEPAKTTEENIGMPLPEQGTTKATYVVVERDPRLDDYTRRMVEAREKNREWYAEYNRERQPPDYAPPPYHENFGVSREEYEHFSVPMNQFREVSRQEISIHRSSRKGKVTIKFKGKDLLISKLVVDPKAVTVETHKDVLPKRSDVDLETATVPPGRHKGVLFNTARATIIAEKRRESVVIGELKDEASGIIRYALKSQTEGNKRCYVQYLKPSQ